jgi:hypothetical protein
MGLCPLAQVSKTSDIFERDEHVLLQQAFECHLLSFTAQSSLTFFVPKAHV